MVILKNYHLTGQNFSKNSLFMRYSNCITIHIKQRWFITTVQVTWGEHSITLYGLGKKDLQKSYYKGEFDNCIEHCLTKIKTLE